MKLNREIKNRLSVACFLLFIEAASILALRYTPYNDDYYIVCSVFNLLIILILPFVSTDNIIVDFQYLNLCGFILQGFGFLTYWYEVPVIYYNYAIHALNAVQILRLLIIRVGDADEYRKNNNWLSVVHYYNFCCYQVSHKKENP